MKQFNAYIDESGDEGVNTGGTNWFLLAAVIVPSLQDLEISECISEARRRLGKKPDFYFHWKNLTHERKKVLIEELTKKDMVLSIVAVNKHLLSRTTTLQHPPWLYNYCTRYLVERVSWYVDDQSGRVNLVFSNRAHTKYTALASYIRRIVADPKSQIRDVIDSISSLPPQQSRLLQAADAVAGAAFNALEPNAWGHTETSYIMTLKDLLYRRGRGKLTSYGFKILGDNHDVEQICNAHQWLCAL